MTTTSTGDQQVANPAAKGGDHDRVAMLSLHADGSPDQHDPEIIGDKDDAVAATAEQFRQQAVSAADVRERGAYADAAGGEVSTTEDPTVERIKAEHDKAAEGADSAAEKVVNALHQGDSNKPAGKGTTKLARR